MRAPSPPTVQGDLFDEMKRTLGRMPEAELVSKVRAHTHTHTHPPPLGPSRTRGLAAPTPHRPK